jgi:toxin FitB
VNEAGWLLDTNVLSELMRAVPNPRVSRFVAGLEQPYLSAVAFHELFFGAGVLPEGTRRAGLIRRIESLRARFGPRIVAIDAETASLSGRLRSNIQRRGRHLTPVDALIAASAMRVSRRLATRNLKDFQFLDLELVDPWAT